MTVQPMLPLAVGTLLRFSCQKNVFASHGMPISRPSHQCSLEDSRRLLTPDQVQLSRLQMLTRWCQYDTAGMMGTAHNCLTQTATASDDVIPVWTLTRLTISTTQTESVEWGPLAMLHPGSEARCIGLFHGFLGKPAAEHHF